MINLNTALDIADGLAWLLDRPCLVCVTCFSVLVKKGIRKIILKNKQLKRSTPFTNNNIFLMH